MTEAPRESAGVRVLTEEELAEWLRERGRRVVLRRGRYWTDHWGFFRLLHFSATISADQLRRPSRTCWAFHALLPDEDAHQANTSYPVHLVRELGAFDEGALDSSARKELRRSRATLRLVRLNDPDLLRTQGWAVFSQNARRLARNTHVTEQEYAAAVGGLTTDTRRLVLGAMDGDRLLGYLETYAVEDTAYLDQIHLSDESRSRHVSGFLHFEATALYRDSGLVEQVCAGPTVSERMGISEFKRRWGIPVVPMPARFWSPRPFQAALKAARPAAYYRALGLPVPEGT